MNGVDGTSREQEAVTTEAPALLTIIVDTNPHAWSLLSNTLPLSTLIANLLVFVNAHLAINNDNQVAVIASHSHSARFLYPTTHDDLPAVNHTQQDANADNDMQNDANKYRPFAQLERALTNNLRALLATTTPDTLQADSSTMLSGALTLALTYIAKATLLAPSAQQSGEPAYDTNTASSTTTTTTTTRGLQSRILILSVSGDIASQYIPIMNTIFACQRLSIPMDILTLSSFSHPEFLQQAADATGGVYMALGHEIHGLLQVLMMAYLPDSTARKTLVTAGETEGVDFRAACFCHRNVVDLGYVCSVCLSIFCKPPPDDTCLTCGTALSLAGHAAKPIVIARTTANTANKTKKKKRRLDNGTTPVESPTAS